MRINDYTKLPVGAKIDGAEVMVCKRCGKPGLAKASAEKLYITHCQAVWFDQRGVPVVNWEWHSQPLAA
jgi:hypothetical protein